jgi:tetratricopeptide (TPR) repeat protein
MARAAPTPVPPTNPEQHRVTAGKFERAHQVIATGHYDEGIRLLLECCKLDPSNLLYRQALRRTEKAKYRNNHRGSRLAWLTAWLYRARLRAALAGRDHAAAMDHAERILTHNPWDVGALTGLARAADGLGMLEVAVWSLEQARHGRPHDPAVNRALAALYERQGNFTQAIKLWEKVAAEDPADPDAALKITNLTAHDYLNRGEFAPAPSSSSVLAASPDAAAQESANVVDPVAREVALLRVRLRDEPANGELYLELARIYRRADQFEEAAEVLREGLDATGNRFELAAEMADLEIDPFRHNLALTEAKLRSTPDDPALRKLRVQLRKEVNTRELELFRQKTERYPSEMAHRYEVGVRLVRAGLFDEAARQLQDVRADARFRWQSLLYLGYCFKARGDLRLALRNFEESLQHLPNGEAAQRKELLFELAEGHAEAGDLARAVELGQELTRLDRGHRAVQRLLEEWQVRLRQTRVAR